jgi:hypothetical protein
MAKCVLRHMYHTYGLPFGVEVCRRAQLLREAYTEPTATTKMNAELALSHEF